MTVNRRTTNTGGATYQDAGVDIAAGNRLISTIAPFAAATKRPGTQAELGGFGGLFDLKAAGFTDPVLIAATDGVGTKLRLAIAADRHGSVGIDLVAMCVNDIVAQGAEPLFFLDYFATSRLDPAIAAAVIEGIAAGCRQAGCALIGGETAELPGFYTGRDYDLAGFAVGACERGTVLPNQANPPATGDTVIALPSNGLHSNGFSLVHYIVDRSAANLDAPAPFADATTLAEALLTPTRILTTPCLAAARTGRVKAFAHITGGGLLENVPRVLPPGLTARLDGTAWPTPPVFAWLAKTGDVAPEEMLRTFNCGVAMVVVVAAADTDAVLDALTQAGDTPLVIGTLGEGTSPVTIDNIGAACGV